jgi:hypothetical protein
VSVSPIAMLPVARIRGRLTLSDVRAALRQQWSWVRARGLPLLVAASWLCGLLALARCSAGSHLRALDRSAMAPIRHLPRPATIGVPAPVAQIDTCEPDLFGKEKPGAIMGHTLYTHRVCEISIPSCAGRR